VNLNENDIASMNLPSHLADGEDGDKVRFNVLSSSHSPSHSSSLFSPSLFSSSSSQSRSGSRMHASALVLLLLSRRGRGFSESSREDGNHLVDGDRGSLTLKDIIPGAALQQSYLAWLRKFQIDQARWTKFERTEMLKSQVRRCEGLSDHLRTPNLRRGNHTLLSSLPTYETRVPWLF